MFEMLESPILVGLLIFAGWFSAIWALSAFLMERCGIVKKYAYPGAIIAVTITVAFLGLLLCNEAVDYWAADRTAFTIARLKIRGGL